MIKCSALYGTGLRQAIILSLLSLTLLTPSQAQQSNSADDRVKGIGLLESGDAVGAAKLLREETKRDKNDLEAWHWLGVALEREGKSADASKAHEKAARLGDALL